ncbi:MAG: DUF4157 domain-containing protein [Aliiglaciecola sp.]|uniref:eCIS core domain-containing protein n=1 Tax=Aliiglaciecola sp. TaxID=1872441 RepID=UPI00329929EE
MIQRKAPNESSSSATQSQAKARDSKNQQVQTSAASNRRWQHLAFLPSNTVKIQPQGYKVGVEHSRFANIRLGRECDIYEQEADRVAQDLIDKKPTRSISPISRMASDGIQTKCKTCECSQEDECENNSIQTKSANNDSPHELKSEFKDVRAAVNTSSSGNGLSADLKNTLENSLGEDLGTIRVHQNEQADKANLAIHSRAFANQNNIFLSKNESPTDLKLMAHEVTHTIQQGHTSSIIQRNPQPNSSDTSFYEAQINNPEHDDHHAQPEVNWAWMFMANSNSDNSVRSEQDASPIFDAWPNNLPLMLSNSGEPGYRIDQDHLPSRYFCPGACHSINLSHQADSYQRMAAQQRRARLAAWSTLHGQQHGAELEQQSESLSEDITQGEFQTSQLRLQLFDLAIGSDNFITENMRDSWAKAQQSSLFLEGVLQIESFALMPELIQEIRLSFVNYFNAMTLSLRDRDSQQRERLHFINDRGPCPNCHSSAQPSSPVFELDSFDVERSALFQMPSQLQNQVTANWLENMESDTNTDSQQTAEEVGPIGGHETRLLDARTQAREANTPAQFRALIAEFRSTSQIMDELLTAAVPQNQHSTAIVEQFNYSQQRLHRQREFFNLYSDAVKIQAIFYPKPEEVDQLGQVENAQGIKEDAANGLPWLFYLTHTPSNDGSNVIPENFEWKLHDLSSPQSSARTVKVRHRLSNIERIFRGDLNAIERQDPPRSLFEQLDHKNFFSKGHLYWNYPHSRQTDSIETTASATFWDWITGIGMAAALLGSLVFAPFSTPMLASVMLGTGLTIAGRVGDYNERSEHGVLTDADVNMFYWDLSMDIVSALSLGMGRVMTGAVQAGRMARAARTSKYWFALQRVELGMNVTNVGIIGAELAGQYYAIKNANMTPEQEQRALRQLTMSGVISGGLSFIPVYTGARDLQVGDTIRLGIHPDNANLPAGYADEGVGRGSIPPNQSVISDDLTSGGRVHPRELETSVHQRAHQNRAEFHLGDGSHGIAPAGEGNAKGFYFCSNQCALLLQKLNSIVDVLPPNFPGRDIYVGLRNQVRHANGRLRSGNLTAAEADVKATEFAAALGRQAAFEPSINRLLQMSPQHIEVNSNSIREQLSSYADIARVHSTAQRHPNGRVRESDIAPDSPEGLGIGQADVGQVPRGHRLPRATEVADRNISGGFWGGQRGHSQWFSDHEGVNSITGFSAVPYRNGEPVLTQWAQEQVILNRMTGINDSDFAAADRGLLRQYPGRWRNQTAVASWRIEQQLTWHHEPDLETMSLVPRALHGNVPHLGGASMARAGQQVERVPVLGDENPL